MINTSSHPTPIIKNGTTNVIELNSLPIANSTVNLKIKGTNRIFNQIIFLFIDGQISIKKSRMHL